MVEDAMEIKEQLDHNCHCSFSSKLPIREFGIDSKTNKKFELKPFQKKSVSHALALRDSANFSVPGAGKTWMAYATYFLTKERRD